MFYKCSRLFGLLLTTLLFTAACQRIQPLLTSQADAMSPAEASRETANQAVVQRFYDEVFTQKKMPVLDEIFDPNLVVHDLDVGGELPGGGLPETLAAFPDVKATVNLWVNEGDLVMAYVTYNGTHQAEYLGVAPTGKAITWSIIDLWRVKDGKIVELWHDIPNGDILEQIQPTAPVSQQDAQATQQSAFTDHPDGTTQARLRLAHFVFGGPNVDLFVNGIVAVNGGQAQVNIPSGYVNGYLYLAPGTYRVAVVPSGKGLDQALGGSLELPLVAGHRYTLAMMGQPQDKSIQPLLIDETTARMQSGAQPTDDVRITVNNLAGAASIHTECGGKTIHEGTPYGGFDAGICPVGNAPLKVTVSNASAGFLINDSADWNEPGVDFLYGFAGKYPGSADVDWGTINAPATSELNIIDFKQGFSGKQLSMHGVLISFDTFLTAIKIAGLTEELAHGGPHLVLAPIDEAFAALPKEKLDALLADPKALGDLVRNHMVAGYVPPGSLAKTPGEPFDRTFTNLLGASITIGDGYTINGSDVGDFGSYFLADGTQVRPITKVLLPDKK